MYVRPDHLDVPFKPVQTVKSDDYGHFTLPCLPFVNVGNLGNSKGQNGWRAAGTSSSVVWHEYPPG